MTWLIVSVLIYCAIGYWFHSAILSEWHKDKSGDLNEIPVWFIKTGFFVCAVFWPILVVWALAESIFRKEDM